MLARHAMLGRAILVLTLGPLLTCGPGRAADPLVTLAPPDGVKLGRAAAFTPDGTGVVAVGWTKAKGADAGLYRWDIKTGRCDRVYADTWSHLVDAWAVRWSADGRRVAVFLDPADHAAVRWLDAVTWKPVARLSATGYADLSGAKPVERHPPVTFRSHPGPALGPDGVVVGLGDGLDDKGRADLFRTDLLRWDPRTNTLTRSSLGMEDLRPNHPPRFSADGRRMAYGAKTNNSLRAVVLDPGSGEQVGAVEYRLNEGLTEVTHQAHLSRTGTYLLTYVVLYPSLHAWRVKNGERLLADKLDGLGRVTSVEPTPRSDRFVVNCWDADARRGVLAVVSPKAGTVTRVADVDHNRLTEKFLAVSADETRVLCPHRGGIRVYPMPAE